MAWAIELVVFLLGGVVLVSAVAAAVLNAVLGGRRRPGGPPTYGGVYPIAALRQRRGGDADRERRALRRQAQRLRASDRLVPREALKSEGAGTCAVPAPQAQIRGERTRCPAQQ